MDIEVDRSSAVWRKIQLEDPELQQLIPLVEAGKKPELYSTVQELKPYLREWDKLEMMDGVLNRNRIDPETGSKVSQLVLPAVEREQALKGLHDDVGHLGRERTLQLVRARFYWPRMMEDVINKVKTCPACIRRKAGSSGSQ